MRIETNYNYRPEANRVFWIGLKILISMVVIALIFVGIWGAYGLILLLLGLGVSPIITLLFYYESGAYRNFMAFLRTRWWMIPLTTLVGAAAAIPFKYLLDHLVLF